jgi:tetratricopeptide (TPR) repeat protein
MKRKPAAKVKRLPSKPKKQKAIKGKRPGRVSPQAAPQPRRSPLEDPRFAQVVENYQVGLKAMQEHKFERAKALFQKVVAGPSAELADRAAVHLSTCNQHLSRTSTVFKSLEEHYDYAVSLMNIGDYVTAREHLEKICKQSPKADFGWYGLAVLNCLTGHYEEALRNLAEAIRLKPTVRFQARKDSDFQSLADDPRFTELIYPENPEEPVPPQYGRRKDR